MLLDETNKFYKNIVKKVMKKCRKLQSENERLVMRINRVRKLIRRRTADVAILKRRLDRHNDGWRVLPVVVPHPKRKIEQKRGPKPKPKENVNVIMTKEKKPRKQRARRETKTTAAATTGVPTPTAAAITTVTQPMPSVTVSHPLTTNLLTKPPVVTSNSVITSSVTITPITTAGSITITPIVTNSVTITPVTQTTKTSPLSVAVPKTSKVGIMNINPIPPSPYKQITIQPVKKPQVVISDHHQTLKKPQVVISEHHSLTRLLMKNPKFTFKH